MIFKFIIAWVYKKEAFAFSPSALYFRIIFDDSEVYRGLISRVDFFSMPAKLTLLTYYR